MNGKKLKFSTLSYIFISVVLNGLQRLSGLFIIELLQTVNVSRQNASMPFAFSWAVANIMASFSDCLTGNEKSDYAILFGVLLTATGAALCIVTTDITTLIVFWGLIFGSGYGIASPHLTRQLTNAKSSKILFLLQVTPSFGVTVMSSVLHVLSSHYGLQGSYLMISGIILNYLPLTIAAAYDIKLKIPNIKWRVRKRNSQYVVSKQERGKIVSDESFVNSLEPELILTINQNDEFHDEISSDIDNSAFSMIETFPMGRRRTQTRCHDLPSLEMDPRMLPLSSTRFIEAVEQQQCNNDRKIFESSFSSNDILCNEEKESNSNNVINIDTKSTTKIMEKNILNAAIKDNIYSNNEIILKVPESYSNETVTDNKIPENTPKNCSELNNKSQEYNFLQPETEIFQTVSEKRENNILLNKNGSLHLMKNTEYEKVSSKHNPQEISTNLDKELLKSPLTIKIHVEECTFINDGQQWYESKNVSYEKNKNSYRSHSNSMIPETCTDFTTQKFPKSYKNSSELQKPKLSNIYSVPEDSKFDDKRVSKHKNSKKTEQKKCMETILKMKEVFKFLNDMTSPGCLCIILITVIFEVNLVTLVIMFADFSNDIDSKCSNLKWILAAFGTGGLVGKFCCCKISRTIPEKSNAIGVILFLLTGLSTAGVVFSTNLKWLTGFYCILGALEGGITFTIPKFISEYVDENRHYTLSSVKSFLSGVAMFGIPYAIGLSRDELGDYEFLLQTLSCSSILCAILVYFLPYLSTSSIKQLSSSSKSKMESA